jgi:uncharacterized membrane protein YbaN (DUF454 family)
MDPNSVIILVLPEIGIIVNIVHILIFSLLSDACFSKALIMRLEMHLYIQHDNPVAFYRKKCKMKFRDKPCLVSLLLIRRKKEAVDGR